VFFGCGVQGGGFYLGFQNIKKKIGVVVVWGFVGHRFLGGGGGGEQHHLQGVKGLVV